MLKFDWNILWTLINLVFFFFLMKKFLFKPIQKALKSRQELIDTEIENARATSACADEKLADYESRIANVDQEAKDIIAQAKDKAKVEYNKIVDKASEDVAQMKQDAQKQIEMDAQGARQAVKEEIAKLAMETAEKVVGEAANAQTDADIYNKFLNESSEK